MRVPKLDINIADFHNRQLAGLWFALWHQWPASRVSFFAELRLDSVDYMLNSWQWNSSSYRWRFNISDFLPLGLGNFLSVGCQKWWWFRRFMSADSYPNWSLFWGGMDSWDLLYWDNFGGASGNLTKHFTRRTGVPKKCPSEPAWFSHNEFHTSFGFSQFRNPQQQKWASNQPWYGHVVTIGFLAEVDDDLNWKSYGMSVMVKRRSI